MKDFVHLHVHSHYSLLDGLPKIPDLVALAKKLEMPALALTDHGVMYGAIEFYKACRRNGIRPIIGVEAYLILEPLTEKKLKDKTSYFHLTLLAQNLTGYQNLLELTTIAHLQGHYYKPLIDKTTLARMPAGLIALSGCIRGEIPKLLAAENLEQAKKVALEYQNLFGEENFYLEIQRNSQNPTQILINQGLLKLHTELDIPLVATNDCHYLSADEKEAQDVLLCIGTGQTVNEPNRLDMRGSSLHLASTEEMSKTFADIPEALENTGKIAEKINLELKLEKYHFPNFPVAPNHTPETYLEELCVSGLKARLAFAQELPSTLEKRLAYELEVIQKKSYAAYFLVVADLVNWARARGIINSTRGSAAGSLVAYALGITNLNPVEYKLPFERFLNPDRPSPPDIDMDFADNRRDEVLQYVSEKYGKNKVAQIVTFGTMMARAAVRDVGRALGVPYSKCDRIAKMIPFGRQGFQISIERALELSPELKEAYEKDPETSNLLKLAKKVEGCARHASIHAAGVVIAPTKLTDFTPLQLDTEFKNIITQYDMRSVEDAGLVKMDFLGIRNLSILGNAVAMVKNTRGLEIDLQKLPLNDGKTFALLSSGRTMGVFQLGGSGMTKYLIELKPTNIFDIMAMISLYRPGPMESIPEFIARKHNPKLISYLDPRLKEILDQSYGVITYQDDVLLIAVKLGGYSWEEADKLRKAMGKKIPKEMAAQKEKFIQGAIANGMHPDKAIKLWSLIEPFAAYGFNKAHAASYAMIAYQTAYMKANFPVEFMAALLSAEADDLNKVAAAVSECRVLQIAVLPPDVNQSLANFTVISAREIRFGLSVIKNLGREVVSEIIAEREVKGSFVSLADFVRRIKSRNFNKKALEALVKSGSLDRFGERNQMLAHTEMILEYKRNHQREEISGQPTLFLNQAFDEKELAFRPVTASTEAEKLAWEKEFLGLYVSAHPLKNHQPLFERLCVAIKNLDSHHDNTFQTLGGMISRIQNILTKKGEPMAFAELEDFGGKIELVVFPSVYMETRTLLTKDRIVVARGKITDKDGELKMLVEKLQAIEEVEKNEAPRVDHAPGIFNPPFVRPPSWAERTPAGLSASNLARNPPQPDEVLSSRAIPVPPSSPSLRLGSQAEADKTFLSSTLLPPNDRLLKIKIPAAANPQIFNKLKEAFKTHPGQTPVILVIPDREGTPREIKTNFHVENSEEFKNRLRELLRESITQI